MREVKNKDNAAIDVKYDFISSFVSDVEKLTNDIIKYFPKFFDDFTNWEYETGVDAGNDFKKIFNKAKRLNKAVANEKLQPPLRVKKYKCLINR